jgi:hypothetical protein
MKRQSAITAGIPIRILPSRTAYCFTQRAHRHSRRLSKATPSSFFPRFL